MNICELYKKNAPRNADGSRNYGSSAAGAYWRGYDGIRFRYVRGSFCDQAYRAGREAREIETGDRDR